MYQSNQGGARRLVGTGLAVGAIQAGFAIVLLTGFAGGMVNQAIREHFKRPEWTYVPPPAHPRHTPVRSDTPRGATRTSPQPAHDAFNPPSELILGPLVPLALPSGDGLSQISDIDTHRAPPPLPPVAARPLGDPGAWITPNDYPARALREGWSGVTRLHLVIDRDGHVSTCTVTASSGHEALDAVACEKVTRRATFTPARDGTGAAREGSYNGAIRWEIHEE